MKKYLGILVLLFGTSALGQNGFSEVVRGLVPVIEATCKLNGVGQLAPDGKVSRPCLMAMKPHDEDHFWMIIYDETDTVPVAVIKVNNKTSTQEIIWRFGELKA